jgi:hypothetical protein
MADLPRDIEKRLAELKKEVPRRGFDRHASQLKDISDLPIELQSPALTALAARETLRTLVLFPQQIQRGWEYVPKQVLLFTATGLIHLLASIWPEQEPQITYVQGKHLLYVKVKLILLYGYLEIAAQGPDAPLRLITEFNTVDWHRLWGPLQQLLQAAQPTPVLPKDPDDPSPVFKRALKELPLKFSNGLQLYGLLPGEVLEEVVFQPGPRTLWLHLFRKLASANTMLLLTSHYMVVVHEELFIKQGWVISYIPRSNIVRMQSRPRGFLNDLSVQLQRGGQVVDYKLMLKNETVTDWCKRWVQHGGEWQELPA